MKKLLIFILPFPIGVTVVAFLVIMGIIPTHLSTIDQNINQSVVLAETTSVTVSPTPIQPSERALKIAAFATIRMSDDELLQFKEKSGDKNMSTKEFVRTFALKMDSDVVMMAQSEAVMERIIAEEKRPIVNEAAPVYIQQPAQVQDSQPQRLKTNCTSNTIGDYTHTNCY